MISHYIFCCHVRALVFLFLSSMVWKKLFLLILLSDLALCGVVSTQTMEQWPSFSKWVQSSKANQHIRSLHEHIFTQDNLGGLEAKSVTGRWLPADPIPGAVLINVGDLLENLSCGRSVMSNISTKATMATTASTGFLQPATELSFPSKSFDEGLRVSRSPSLSIQMIRWWSEWSKCSGGHLDIDETHLMVHPDVRMDRDVLLSVFIIWRWHFPFKRWSAPHWKAPIRGILRSPHLDTWRTGKHKK